MKTHRRSRRISRAAAHQLLSGSAGRDPDQLARLLAAAAAPAHESELSGEAAAVAAFEAHHLAPPAIPGRGQMIKSPLAKFLSVKALAVTTAVCLSGGVAAAASTGVLRSSASVHAHVGARQPVAPVADGTSHPATGALNPAQLCRKLASQVSAAGDDANAAAGQVLTQAGIARALASSGVSQVLTSPTFSPLISAADNAASVPDYCALLLGVPKLPDPAGLSQLPPSILTQLMSSLPMQRVAQLLMSLPAGASSQVLTVLPAGTLSQVLTTLPAAGLSQVLTTLPAAGLSQVLTTLPAAGLSQVLTALPARGLAQILGQLPTVVLTKVIAELRVSVAAKIVGELPSAIVAKLPASLLSGLQLG